jgi:hypothetical protein
VGGHALDQAPDRVGVVRAVVAPVDQRPLEEDAPVERGGEVPAGVHQLVEGPLPGGGDQRHPLRLGGGVERDRQVHRAALVGHPADAGDDPDRADRDPLGAQPEAARVAQDVGGLHDRVIVVEGLAHAHENDVAQAPRLGRRRELAGDVHDLRHHLGGRQVPAVAHLPGGAEDAAHRAARLAADAGGGAALEAHEDGLDRLAVGEPEEELAGEAVGGGGGLADRQGAQLGAGREPGPHPRRQRREFPRVGR